MRAVNCANCVQSSKNADNKCVWSHFKWASISFTWIQVSLFIIFIFYYKSGKTTKQSSIRYFIGIYFKNLLTVDINLGMVQVILLQLFILSTCLVIHDDIHRNRSPGIFLRSNIFFNPDRGINGILYWYLKTCAFQYFKDFSGIG